MGPFRATLCSQLNLELLQHYWVQWEPAEGFGLQVWVQELVQKEGKCVHVPQRQLVTPQNSWQGEGYGTMYLGLNLGASAVARQGVGATTVLAGRKIHYGGSYSPSFSY